MTSSSARWKNIQQWLVVQRLNETIESKQGKQQDLVKVQFVCCLVYLVFFKFTWQILDLRVHNLQLTYFQIPVHGEKYRSSNHNCIWLTKQVANIGHFFNELMCPFTLISTIVSTGLMLTGSYSVWTHLSTRFLCTGKTFKELTRNGQRATHYRSLGEGLPHNVEQSAQPVQPSMVDMTWFIQLSIFIPLLYFYLIFLGLSSALSLLPSCRRHS